LFCRHVWWREVGTPNLEGADGSVQRLADRRHQDKRAIHLKLGELEGSCCVAIIETTSFLAFYDLIISIQYRSV